MDLLSRTNPPLKRPLLYPATCSLCEQRLERGTVAYWDKETHRAACLACMGDADAFSELRGRPGASASRRALSLQRRGTDDPVARAWAKGGAGETQLGAFLDSELADVGVTIHDRLVPGAERANIDHIAVVPTGVWIVDTKAYVGAIRRGRRGALIRVAGRNRTSLVDGVERQVGAVRVLLDGRREFASVEVHGAVCFLDGHWAKGAQPFEARGIAVVDQFALRQRLRRMGLLGQDAIIAVGQYLMHELRRAVT